MSNINMLPGDTLELDTKDLPDGEPIMSTGGTRVYVPKDSVWVMKIKPPDRTTQQMVKQGLMSAVSRLPVVRRLIGKYRCEYCLNIYLKPMDQCPTCGARRMYEDYTEP